MIGQGGSKGGSEKFEVSADDGLLSENRVRHTSIMSMRYHLFSAVLSILVTGPVAYI